MKHFVTEVFTAICSLLLVAGLVGQATAAEGRIDSGSAVESAIAEAEMYVPEFADTTRAGRNSGEMPSTFGLHQNYPNPFNPTTSIKYEVASQTNVRLVVYDMLGKQVSTLVDRRHMPGTYQVRFDASHLTSGVYILSMKAAGGFHAVRRMVLTK